ncbi:MAG: desulfoferrodoxin [Clostridia bacterium]|nr:desulfoferrodoxin [Clostridia bacterium]
MKNTKFYICPHCKNVITKLSDSGVGVVCCGEKMKELVPGEVEASVEKHLPVVNYENGVVSVCVGSVNHPMTSEHYIPWVYVEFENGGFSKHLTPDSEPTVSFNVGDDKPTAVYAYCNLHGLWKTNI